MLSSAMVVALLAVTHTDSFRGPTWNTDYAVACKVAKDAGKPLAVFVGKGQEGWNKVSRTGELSEEALQILAAEYISLFVDTDSSAGQELAEALELADGLGIVITDRSGESQAFYHAGDLEDSVLHGYLKRFADPELAVGFTVTNPSNESTAEEDPSMTRNRYRPIFRGSVGRGC